MTVVDRTRVAPVDLDGYPIGTVVTTPSGGSPDRDVWQKLRDGRWYRAGGTATGVNATELARGGLELLYRPALVAQVGDRLVGVQDFTGLPVLAVVLRNACVWQKTDDDEWNQADSAIDNWADQDMAECLDPQVVLWLPAS